MPSQHSQNVNSTVGASVAPDYTTAQGKKFVAIIDEKIEVTFGTSE